MVEAPVLFPTAEAAMAAAEFFFPASLAIFGN
jgi:hypothetical protein